MKIKHREIEISNDYPFQNCKLEREPYAQILTDIVSTYADGFVLAINNGWGTGKTTFVKMWEQQLKSKGFQTIYFNAWENDFDNNPLVALMSELETLTNEGNKRAFKSTLEKGAVLVKNIAPSLVKALINKHIISIDEMTADAVENALKASTEILENEIKEYKSKKKTIVEFRRELGEFVKQSGNQKPLIFIVDELDRCRPNYAVEVLEQIKHFFSVPGIVFVLSIDKKHLSSSVKGFYGSQEIDSNEYLRRFIDLEYSIPVPSIKLFNEYLYEYYGFDEFFLSEKRATSPDFRDDGNTLLKIAEILFSNPNTTLRKQERVFALSRLVLCSFKETQNTFPVLFFLIVYLKVMKNDLFQKIEKKELSFQELSDAFFDLIPQNVKKTARLDIIRVEALLLSSYNDSEEYYDRIELLTKDEAGSFTTPIKSKLDSENGDSRLIKHLESINKYGTYRYLSSAYLIKMINLTEPIRV